MESNQKQIRLNKYLAHAGIANRRECDKLIIAGLVSVNGNIISETGTKIQLNDVVSYRGEIVKPEKKVYMLVNKPKDFTFENTETKLDVRFIIKSFAEKLNLGYQPEVFSVDDVKAKDLGLVLVSNDNSLKTSLSNTSCLYTVALDKALSKKDKESLIRGIEIENELIKFKEINFLDETEKFLGIQIKFVFASKLVQAFEYLKYTVLSKDRTAIAQLNKRDLPRGKWRFLKPNEIIKIKHLKY